MRKRRSGGKASEDLADFQFQARLELDAKFPVVPNDPGRYLTDNLPSLNAPVPHQTRQFRIDVRVPTGVTGNAVPVWVAIGGATSQPSVTRTVK